MRHFASITAAFLFGCSLQSAVLFEEPFTANLKPGWSWIREDPNAWRVRDGTLEIKIEPGNMWGPENSGKNVLVRSLPADAAGEIAISVIVENAPTHQYEQCDLVLYFDDSHMVKIGEELVDGKLSVVMGREENDKTRTITIVPLAENRVQLQLRVRDRQVTGRFRPGATGDWQTAGTCDLPAPGQPRIALQCYQGAPEQEHWAKIRKFVIEGELK